LPDVDAQIMIDNHDNQRGHGGGGDYLTFFEFRRYKIATAFMLSWPYGSNEREIAISIRVISI
jgi:alpha-amylase